MAHWFYDNNTLTVKGVSRLDWGFIMGQITGNWLSISLFMILLKIFQTQVVAARYVIEKKRIEEKYLNISFYFQSGSACTKI